MKYLCKLIILLSVLFSSLLRAQNSIKRIEDVQEYRDKIAGNIVNGYPAERNSSRALERAQINGVNVNGGENYNIDITNLNSSCQKLVETSRDCMDINPFARFEGSFDSNTVCECLNQNEMVQGVLKGQKNEKIKELKDSYLPFVGSSILKSYISLIEQTRFLQNLETYGHQVSHSDISSCHVNGFIESMKQAKDSCENQELANERFQLLFQYGFGELTDHSEPFKDFGAIELNLKENIRVWNSDKPLDRNLRACVSLGDFNSYDILSMKVGALPKSHDDLQRDINSTRNQFGRALINDKILRVTRNPLVRVILNNESLLNQIRSPENQEISLLELFKSSPENREALTFGLASRINDNCDGLRDFRKYQKLFCEEEINIPPEYINEKHGGTLRSYQAGVTDEYQSEVMLSLANSCQNQEALSQGEPSIFDDILLENRNLTVKETFEHSQLRFAEEDIVGMCSMGSLDEPSGNIFEFYDNFNIENCPLVKRDENNNVQYLRDYLFFVLGDKSSPEYNSTVFDQGMLIYEELASDSISEQQKIEVFRSRFSEFLNNYYETSSNRENLPDKSVYTQALENLDNNSFDGERSELTDLFMAANRDSPSFYRQANLMDYMYNGSSMDEAIVSGLSSMGTNVFEATSNHMMMNFNDLANGTYFERGIPETPIGESIYTTNRIVGTTDTEFSPSDSTAIEEAVNAGNNETPSLELVQDEVVVEVGNENPINDAQDSIPESSEVVRVDREDPTEPTDYQPQFSVTPSISLSSGSSPVSIIPQSQANESRRNENRSNTIKGSTSINSPRASFSKSRQSDLEKLLAMRDSLKNSNKNLIDSLKSLRNRRKSFNALDEMGIDTEKFSNNGFNSSNYANPSTRNPYQQFGSTQVNGSVGRHPASVSPEGESNNNQERERITDKASYFPNSSSGSSQSFRNGKSSSRPGSSGAVSGGSSSGGSLGGGFLAIGGEEINFEKINNLSEAIKEINAEFEESIPGLFEEERPYVLKKVIPHSLILNSTDGYRQLIDELGIEGRRFTTLDVYFVDDVPNYIVRVYDYNIGNDVINDKEFRVNLIRTIDLVKSDSMKSKKYLDSIKDQKINQRDQILNNISAKLELMYERPACSNPGNGVSRYCVGDEEINDLKQRLLRQDELIKMIDIEIDKQLIN